MERTVRVKEIDWKDGARGQYMSVVLDEGTQDRKYAIFDPNIQDTLTAARNDGLPVLIEVEKKGNFWNVTSAQLVHGEPKGKPKPDTGKATDGRTWKDDEILLAVAFKGAVELECHLVPGAEPNTARVIQTTSELLAGLMLMRPKRVE